jgi:hypothetical protein
MCPQANNARAGPGRAVAGDDNESGARHGHLAPQRPSRHPLHGVPTEMRAPLGDSVSEVDAGAWIEQVQVLRIDI